MKIYEVVLWEAYEPDQSFGFFESEELAHSARQFLIDQYQFKLEKEGQKHTKTAVRSYKEGLEVREHETQTLVAFKGEWGG